MAVKGERAFLGHLEGGCQVPIAAHGKIEGNTFILSGLVADTDGRTVIKETVSGSPSQSETIGIELAERLLSKGAKTILERIYSSFAPP
jgi:hydroxymethylbilane synthase